MRLERWREPGGTEVGWVVHANVRIKGTMQVFPWSRSYADHTKEAAIRSFENALARDGLEEAPQ